MKNYLSILFLLFTLTSLQVLAKEDFTTPVISTLSPLDDATNVSINSDFVITFDQLITLVMIYKYRYRNISVFFCGLKTLIPEIIDFIPNKYSSIIKM